VIQKADAGGNLISTAAFNRKRELDLRFRSDPLNGRFSHRAA
jgi:hypothetical protein